jgi:leucyl/phenylalanyl-tRNA--protein transferase
MSNRTKFNLTPDVILRAYMLGVFPMAEDVSASELFWVDPETRGVLPLDEFHVPRRLKRSVRNGNYEVRIDTAFKQVMENCRAPKPDRPNSWINDEILYLYCNLAERGHAHSIECWHDEKLVGGLYGVSIGAAFFGESMFSFMRDASKVALVYLVARLKYGGYSLLDTQFNTDHLSQFGVKEVPRGRYHTYLQTALEQPADFYSLPVNASPETVLQASGQRS